MKRRKALPQAGISRPSKECIEPSPEAAAGTATLGLSMAWVNGPKVKIPVR